jgi:hypothetical protein
MSFSTQTTVNLLFPTPVYKICIYRLRNCDLVPFHIRCSAVHNTVACGTPKL